MTYFKVFLSLTQDNLDRVKENLDWVREKLDNSN